MASASKDRLETLLDPANTTLNGIDFVEIASADQRTLKVHFLNTVNLVGTVSQARITGGETIRRVPVDPIDDTVDWSTDGAGRPVLTLTVPAPGDFSFYTLTLTSTALDPFFDHVSFSFKALCPSDLDCRQPPEVCPPPSGDPPPIDYLAKDFMSFRQALLDFSAPRYPEWKERSEADFGVMFLEALCALADDLSYTQDRIAAEATLDTATQRRSLVRHARLVDYEPRPATAARVILQLEVSSGPIPPGLVFTAQGPDGSEVPFESGTGLIDPQTGKINTTNSIVSPLWNRMTPYYWDGSQRCLRRGATVMWVEGDRRDLQGQAILIDTSADISADPPAREIVRVTETILEFDPLFPGPPAPPTPVTRLRWSADDALKKDHDLTRTTIRGNLVPATQGRRYSETFFIPPAPATAAHLPLALERTGANGTPQYLYPLRNAPLAWLLEDEEDAVPQPEIVLEELPPAGSPEPWSWKKRLLDAVKFERAFTVDPAAFRPIARNSDNTFSFDYDGDGGDSVRFGDGTFGEIPPTGRVFRVQYRVGGGVVGNVAADSIKNVHPSAAGFVSKVTNPFPAKGGQDREPDERVRRLAPQAFRARQFRAVRPEDYQKEAQRLPWVQRAGTVFCWTGSWLTVFTTVDPLGSEELPVTRHTELIDLLNRLRMAGYESYVPAPRYASLDLEITVCARPDAFQGDVEAAVLAALSTERFPDGSAGFFHVDNFTFGTPLERSRLEAAIQRAYGVAGVLSIRYRQRGVTSIFIDLPGPVRVRPEEILRVDNNPSRPERGSLKVIVEGGK